MAEAFLLPQYIDRLLEGRRRECKQVVEQALRHGTDARDVYMSLLWPAMEAVDRLYREDKANLATEHMATRITRWLASQLQAHLPQAPCCGKRVLIVCADGEAEELGASMAADLFEAAGWETFFVGGGVPHDEVLGLVGRFMPHILLVFGTTPQGVPGVRRLVDLIREIGIHPTMNVMVSGGVFNRAEGLWHEVGADLYAPTVREALELAAKAAPRKPEIRIAGVPKKRRRRRRPPLLAQLEA